MKPRVWVSRNWLMLLFLTSIRRVYLGLNLDHSSSSDGCSNHERIRLAAWSNGNTQRDSHHGVHSDLPNRHLPGCRVVWNSHDVTSSHGCRRNAGRSCICDLWIRTTSGQRMKTSFKNVAVQLFQQTLPDVPANNEAYLTVINSYSNCSFNISATYNGRNLSEFVNANSSLTDDKVSKSYQLFRFKGAKSFTPIITFTTK